MGQEAYIIDIPGGISTATVSKTLSDVAAGNMLFVNNYERARNSAAAAAAAPMAPVSSSNNQPATSSSSSSSSTVSSFPRAIDEDDSEDGDVLGLVGVVLGALGLLAGIGALALISSKNNEPQLAAPLRDVEEAMDTKTLGSKRVA